MTDLWLTRARLRREAGVQALAQLLMPRHPNDKAAADHHLVWSLMSRHEASRRDFLFRTEGSGQFFVLAPRVPEESDLFSIDSKPFTPNLAAGDRLGFLLRANATIARRASPGQRGKRQDVVMDRLHAVPPADRATARLPLVRQAGQDWLQRVGEASGFIPDLGSLAVDGYAQVRIKRTGAKPLVLSQLDFSGVLRVGDPLRFLTALAQGFGHGRAFGLGLMLIRRAI